MTELQRFYERERERLMALAALDKPQGEYRNPVFGWGDTRSGIILFGEAPGAEETLQSVPFVGKAGKQLNELLAASKIARGSIYIAIS